MKTINIVSALALFTTIVMAQADDAGKQDKPPVASPGFTDPSKLTEKAPEIFKVQFDTTKGKFVIEVTRSLSPNGADRFYNMVRPGYFKDVAFFRVVSGFIVPVRHSWWIPRFLRSGVKPRFPMIPSKAAMRVGRSPSPPPVPIREPRNCSLTFW